MEAALTEDEVAERYGTSYDQAKRPPPQHPAAGGSGGDAAAAVRSKPSAADALPDRHLTGWFLVKVDGSDSDSDGGDDGGDDGVSSSLDDGSPARARARAVAVRGGMAADPSRRPRHPLPEDNILTDGHVVYGYLQLNTSGGDKSAAAAAVPRGGSDAGAPPPRLAVRIAEASIWTIDRTRAGRGIWLHSPRACYRLLAPDEERLVLPRLGVRGPGPRRRRRDGGLEGSSDDDGDDDDDNDDDDDKDGEGGAAAANATRPRREATLPSQADLHLPLRARFGLLSNLLDLMSEPYNNNANNYVPVHARRSPANIHALLSPNDDTYQRFHTPDEPLNREPFDLELLERCPDFVRRHLLHYHPLLHEGCAFMKRLGSMTTATTATAEGGGGGGGGGGKDASETTGEHRSLVMLLDSDGGSGGGGGRVGAGPGPGQQQQQRRRKSPWTRQDYLRSATEAEERGQRTAWGEELPDAKPIKPNRLIDIEIRNAARGAAIGYRNSPDGGKKAAVAASAATAAPKIPAVAGGGDGGGGGGGGGGSAASTTNLAMAAIPKKRSGEEQSDAEEGEIYEDRRAQPSTAAAMITPTPPSKQQPGHGQPPPPPVQQNPVPRAPRRSPDAPPRPAGRNHHGFPPIFVMTSSGRPQFSTPSMVQAIRFFSPYLTPVPHDEDLSSSFVDYQRYSIRPDKIWSFIDNILQNSSVLSLEAMLLSADCFGRGSAEMSFKCLLTKKGKADAISPLQTLFVVWPDHVLQMADQTCRCSTAPGTGRMQGQQLPVDSNKRPEVMTAIAIMNLVRRFGDCIRTAEQLEELKIEFGVDWYDLCNRAIGVAKRHNLDALSRACYYARAQLDNIKVVQGYEAESLIDQLTGSTNQVESAPNSAAKSVDSGAQPSYQSREHSPQQQQLAVSAMDHGRRRVSALDLPDMEKKDWMLKPPKYHQCKFFQRLNFCKNGPDCRYAHVYRPPHPLPNEVPTETLLHLLYAERNISLTTRDLAVVSATGKDDKQWFTAALRCPIDQTIYYATGGVNSHLSNQGVYFYSSPREAIAAVAGIAVLAMKNEEELQEYGLLAFPSAYKHQEPSMPLQQQQQPSRQNPQTTEPGQLSQQPRHGTMTSEPPTYVPAAAAASRQVSQPTSFSFSELVPPSERVKQQPSVNATEPPAVDQDVSFVQILEPARKKTVETTEPLHHVQAPAPPQEERKKPASIPTSDQKKEASDSAAANAAVAKWTSISRKSEPKAKPSAKETSTEKREVVPPPIQPSAAELKEAQIKSMEAPQVGSRITVEDAELLNSPLLEKIRQAQESQRAGHAAKSSAAKVPTLEDSTAKKLWQNDDDTVQSANPRSKVKKVSAAATAAANDELDLTIDERTKAEAVKAALKEKAKAEKAAAKAAKVAAKARAKREAEEKKRLDEEAAAKAQAASIAAEKKKSATKKAKAKADKPKTGKKARKANTAPIAPAASAIQRPPEIERRKPRQSLFSKLPPRRLEYHRRKSAKRPSSGIPMSSTAVAGENSSETAHMEIIPYWDTLGSCRLDASIFHWTNPTNGSATPSPNPFGYDKKLGRAYYSSFVLHGKQFNVGDYIVRSEYDGEDILRIVGAFQATKSFLGRWGGGYDWDDQKTSEEIQKRGHPYILTVPLVTKSSLAKAKAGRKRKATDSEEEIVISAEHGSNIFPLPQWLGEAQVGGYRKISVRVSCTGLNGMETEVVIGDDMIASAKAPKKGTKGGRGKKKSQFGDSFVCKEAVVPEASTTVGLNSQQFELLTCSPDTLLNTHIPDLWDSRFKATQVQMINRERSMEEDLFSEGKMVQFQYTGQSSDDSDSFDDEDDGGEESDME